MIKDRRDIKFIAGAVFAWALFFGVTETARFIRSPSDWVTGSVPVSSTRLSYGVITLALCGLLALIRFVFFPLLVRLRRWRLSGRPEVHTDPVLVVVLAFDSVLIWGFAGMPAAMGVYLWARGGTLLDAGFFVAAAIALEAVMLPLPSQWRSWLAEVVPARPQVSTRVATDYEAALPPQGGTTPAGYCRVCGRNVLLETDGTCPAGHAASEITCKWEAGQTQSLRPRTWNSTRKALVASGLVSFGLLLIMALNVLVGNQK